MLLGSHKAGQLKTTANVVCHVASWRLCNTPPSVIGFQLWAHSAYYTALVTQDTQRKYWTKIM